MKIIYISFNTNSWSRTALFESALSDAQFESNEVSFFQSYIPETFSLDLPFSNKIEMKKFERLDRHLKDKLRLHGVFLEQLTYESNQHEVLIDDNDFQIGYEETISKTRDSDPCGTHTRRAQLHYAKQYRALKDYLTDFLIHRSPDLVVIFNGRFYRENAAWHAALKLGIQVRFVERFSPSWSSRYFTFQEPVHKSKYRCGVIMDFCLQKNLFGSERELGVAQEWFSDRESGVTQRFTEIQNTRFVRDFSKKLIVFFHSSEDELLTTNLRSNIWHNQISFVKELARFSTLQKNIQLVIRLHPNLQSKSSRDRLRWRNLARNLSSESIVFILPESSISSYGLLRDADAVITFGSTIGIEASAIGKLSILAGPALHEDLGATVNLTSFEDLSEYLNSPITEERLLERKYAALAYGYFYAKGGIHFQSVTLVGNSHSQDPRFSLFGVPLYTSRIFSFGKRLEGILRKRIVNHSDFNCNCE